MKTSNSVTFAIEEAARAMEEAVLKINEQHERIDELKHENAVLRQQLEDVQRVRDSIEGALVDAYDEAEADWMSKSRLADAAEEVLKAYINVVRVETGHPCPEDLVICRQLRAALDAARKETQP